MDELDKEHQKYYKAFPNGNHDKPSRETLKMFADMERRLETKMDGMINNFNNQISKKVDFSTFTWVFGLGILAILGIQGIIYAKVENIYKETNETNNIVANIQGKLAPFNFIMEE